MMILCTLCARGGSRGVPGKNLRLMAGRPLLAYSVGLARESGLFAHIAFSSDDPDILAAANRAGAGILVRRPDALARDETGKLLAIRHCVEAAEAEIGARCDRVIDLDVTSPLRNLDDLRSVCALLDEDGVDNVITATPARRSPYFNMVELDGEGHPRLVKTIDPPLVRRQDAPPCFDMNASIYGWRREALFSMPGLFGDGTRLHVMPAGRSWDIDSPEDFERVETLLMKMRQDA